MIATYQPRNVYSPSTVVRNPSVWSGVSADQIPVTSGINSLHDPNSTSRSQVDQYLGLNGRANPVFATSTAGRLMGDQAPITRGYIRRANPNSGSPMADTVLRFMYNPESITRDYASYLDQAAIDPFNTVFQSGNLVAPPSVVQFSFDLLFDRGIEAVNGTIPEGVGVDYTYFDMVLRNVPPAGSSTSTVPDNGVMMVNPEDVLVVFSDKLTVQGRPINARVQFMKFTNEMVPTRMAVSITMIVNYFGPLTTPFGLDANQAIPQYRALIPYDDITSPFGITSDAVKAGIKQYQDKSDADQAQIAQLVSTKQPWWNVVGTAVGNYQNQVATGLAMAGPLNDDIRAKALFAAIAEVELGRQQFGVVHYSQDQRTSVPEYFDCSSLVWKAYQLIGAQSVFGPSAWPNTSAMLAYWESTNWATMQRVLSWNTLTGPLIQGQIISAAQPGDLLFIRTADRGHIAFVQSVDKVGAKITHFAAHSPSSNPEVGSETSTSGSIAQQFRYLLRPQGVGSSTAGGANTGRLL